MSVGLTPRPSRLLIGSLPGASAGAVMAQWGETLGLDPAGAGHWP